MKNKWVLVAGIAAVLVLAFVVVALPALAQAPTGQPAQSSGNAGAWQNMLDYCRQFWGGQVGGMMRGGFGGRGGMMGW